MFSPVPMCIALMSKAPSNDCGFLNLGDEQIAFSIIRSKRRRRTVAFRLETDSSLRVVAPWSASVNSVMKILKKRVPWIARQRAMQKANPQMSFSNGSTFPYLGHACVLRVTQGGNASRFCALSPRLLRVHVPDVTLSAETLREEVKLEILLWLKRRARAKLKQRLDIWAKKMGVRYKKFVISDPERRWGSCSVDNVIRLNWRLMMAPLAVLDYVVAHELSHVKHKNHSKRFWNFLAQAMPDCAERRRQLRKIEHSLAM